MKKTLATIGATTALAFAGLGAATMASAQTTEADTDTTTSEATEDGTSEGRRGEGRGNRGEGRGHGGRGGCSEAVAELLGLDADELRAELDAGATLAEIAEANGVDPEVLIDQMVADATERMDERVAEGRLTEDEAADKLADKSERIEDRVYGTESDSDDSDSDDSDSDDSDSDDAVEGEGS